MSLLLSYVRSIIRRVRCWFRCRSRVQLSPHYAATTTNSNGSTGLWHNVFENTTTVRFDPRVLATTTTTYIQPHCSSYRAGALPCVRRWPRSRSEHHGIIRHFHVAISRTCVPGCCAPKRAALRCSLWPSTSSSRCAGLVPLHWRGNKPIWREERERQRQPGKSPKLSYDFHLFTLGDIQGRSMYPQTLRGQGSLRHTNADALVHPIL